MEANQAELKRPGGGFGNHRKYESLDARSRGGTGEVVETYVRWVNPPNGHVDVVADTVRQTNGDPQVAFDMLYRSMGSIARFGRTARFDYLCMVAKLGLAPIAPGSAYMTGATGPIGGGRLLFTGDLAARVAPVKLDEWLVLLDADLGVGMQVLEDALCNWQKSPAIFVPFRG